MRLNEQKHRFIIDNVVEVVPFNVQKLKIKYKQESGQLFFRKELSGKIAFKKGCCGGYDTESNGLPIVDAYDYIEQGKRMYCKRFYLTIEERCGGQWNNIYDGYFTIYDCDWNEDLHTIEAKVDTNDGYDCLLQKWDVEQNLFDIENRTEINGIELVSWLEVIVVDIKEEEEPEGQDLDDLETTYPGISNYRWICARGYRKGGNGAWWHVHFFVRECSNRKINFTFQQDYNTGLWCRKYNEADTPRAPLVLCGSDFNVPNPDVNDPTWEEFININQDGDDIWLNSAGFIYYDDIKIKNNLDLNDIMNNFVDKLQCSEIKGYSSELFTNQVNYVTGETPNPLLNIYVNQKSNVVRFFASQSATKFNVSLKKYLKYIEILFQSFMYLKNGIIIVEHISNLQPTLGIDLTIYEDGKYILGKNKYNYSRAEMATREEWIIGDDKRNFIEYPVRCTSSDVIKKYSEADIYTSTSSMMGNEDAGLEGSVFIHKDNNGDIVNNNAYLRMENLIFNYWLDQRPFISGSFNRLKAFKANTTQKFKTQDNIKYKVNCFNFDPNQFIITQLGNGRIKSSEYNLFEKTIEIKLIHDE